MCVPIVSYSGLTDFNKVTSMIYVLYSLCLYLEEVLYQSIVGDLEDGCLGVLVDGDDHLAVLHARQVLDSPGYPHRDVQVLAGGNMG